MILARGVAAFTTKMSGLPARSHSSTVAPAAPFFAVTVFARGLLDRLFTRAYLPAAADDPFLATLDPDRRSTLVVTEPQPGGGYVFDVYLQGERETVFLSYPRH